MSFPMNVYTPLNTLGFQISDFPDGQPHFKLLYADKAPSVTIEAPIRNSRELVLVRLAWDVLANHYSEVNLDIRYLMGARMDRPIDKLTPGTLGVVAQMLRPLSFAKIRVLDPHSKASLDTLKAHAVLPSQLVREIVTSHGSDQEVVVISPDKGATDSGRIKWLSPEGYPIVQAHKHRDSATGKLSHFSVDAFDSRGKTCIILDDICDGGGTFTGIAKELRSVGVKAVHLYVTHGIFSKGHRLQGIDSVWTTDSYHDWHRVPFGPNAVALRMRDLS